MRNKSKYPDNWRDTIRPRILKRDNYQCKICGVKHRKCYVFEKDGSKFEIPENELKEWIEYGDKAYKVFLQVAHLDRNRENNEDYNLLSMCPKCHLNYDRQHNILMRKAKLRING